MSDPVMDAYTMAYNSSGNMVQAFGVITEGGQVLWQSNNWDLTITQNNVRYSTMRTTPESLVARNVQGSGILILAKIEGEKWVVAWCAPDAQPDGVYVDIDRAAKTLKGKI